MKASDLNLSCRRASELLSEAMDRPLSRGERVGLWIHLRLCGACRRFRHQLLLMRNTLRDAGATGDVASGNDPIATNSGAVLSDAARERIRRALGNPH